jgi:ketosteroid isomerase-like protein
MSTSEKMRQPEDLGRFFLRGGNKGDLEGLVALYEPNAVLAFPSAQITIGQENIRRVYQEMLPRKPKFEGEVLQALRSG